MLPIDCDQLKPETKWPITWCFVKRIKVGMTKEHSLKSAFPPKLTGVQLSRNVWANICTLHAYAYKWSEIRSVTALMLVLQSLLKENTQISLRFLREFFKRNYLFDFLISTRTPIGKNLVLRKLILSLKNWLKWRGDKNEICRFAIPECVSKHLKAIFYKHKPDWHRIVYIFI